MNKDDVFNIIANHSREIIPALATHPFQWSDQLAELGANSMDRADIVMMTLESLALRMPLTALANTKNIGELADLLHAKLQSS